MRILYIMMALAVASSAADDPGGWSKARWGMTDEEILKAFDGQVVRFAAVDPHQRARVGIEALDVAGIKVKVYMAPGSDEKLEHILFAPALADQTDDTFQAFENLLVQKYGKPWKSDDSSNTELQWTFPTTVITLTRSELPRLAGMPRTILVHLVYKKRVENPL